MRDTALLQRIIDNIDAIAAVLSLGFDFIRRDAFETHGFPGLVRFAAEHRARGHAVLVISEYGDVVDSTGNETGEERIGWKSRE